VDPIDGGKKLVDALKDLGILKFWLGPRHTVAMAHATAEAKQILAVGEEEAKHAARKKRKELKAADGAAPPSIRALPPTPDVPLLAEVVDETSLDERAMVREVTVRARHQRNVEQIARGAAEELEGKTAEADPLDEDWVDRFFDAARHVSSDQMQRLWSRLLAGEVRTPGSFSLRTLETLRNLSPDEGNLFARVLPFVSSHAFVLPKMQSFTAAGVTYGDFLALAEAGLATVEFGLSMQLKLEAGVQRTLMFTDLCVLYTPDHDSTMSLEANKLTASGKALWSLTRAPADRNYVRDCAQHLRSLGLSVRTWPGRLEGNTFHQSSEEDVFPVTEVPTVDVPADAMAT
jgi:hypothetical protein